jgi:hypothetical protein
LVDVELRSGWYTSGLPGAECRRQTYCLRSIEQLPTIRADLVGDFRWLPLVLRPLDWSISAATDPPGNGRFLARARAEAIDIPASLVALVASPRRLWGLRSGTGCWWSLDEDSVQSLPASGSGAIRFLTDQQGALFWYVLLDGTPDPPIIVSHQDFSDDETWEPSPVDHVYACAPSLEAFLYRSWMEDEIRFRTTEKEALTPEQLDYLMEARRLYGD